MAVRGVRGAIDVATDEPQAILAATRTLLLAIRDANPKMMLEDVASALFTTTLDLHSAPPARAARELGWTDVPLLCAQEMTFGEGLPGIVRVLIHWNTELPQKAIRHVYLGEASCLRPDLDGRASLTAPGQAQLGRPGIPTHLFRPGPHPVGEANLPGECHDDCDESRC